MDLDSSSEEETKDEIVGDSEDEEKDEDESASASEDEDGKSTILLDLTPQESNATREDEEMHEETVEQIEEQLVEGTEELANHSNRNQNCIRTDEVQEYVEGTPTVLDATAIYEELEACKIELVRLEARKHLLNAQNTFDEVCIENLAMEKEQAYIDIKHRREQEKREKLHPEEEML